MHCLATTQSAEFAYEHVLDPSAHHERLAPPLGALAPQIVLATLLEVSGGGFAHLLHY